MILCSFNFDLSWKIQPPGRKAPMRFMYRVAACFICLTALTLTIALLSQTRLVSLCNGEDSIPLEADVWADSNTSQPSLFCFKEHTNLFKVREDEVRVDSSCRRPSIRKIHTHIRNSIPISKLGSSKDPAWLPTHCSRGFWYPYGIRVTGINCPFSCRWCFCIQQDTRVIPGNTAAGKIV